MKLPVNTIFHPETETPLSLASRLAAAMGYACVADLLGETTVRAVARGDDDALKMLSSWSDVPVQQLKRFAVPATENAGEWQLGDAVFRKEMRVAGRFRFCPRCLVDDVECGGGRPQSRPYERAYWITRAVLACTRHGELLVEAAEDAPVSDVARFVIDGWHLKSEPSSPGDAAELEVDKYIERRIGGNRTQSFIDRQEVHVLLILFNSLGLLLHKHLPSVSIGGLEASSIGPRAAGFFIASGGLDDIEDIVKEAIERHRPDARSITAFFGPLVRYLRRNSASPAYGEIISVFQEFVERYAPVGPGDRFIFPVQQRRIHSIRSAANEYGLNQGRVKKLLADRRLVERSSCSDRRVYFSLEDGQRPLGDAANSLTCVEVATVLGTHDGRIRDLIERGLLVAAERGVKGDRPYYRVALSDLNEFRTGLFEHAVSRKEGLFPLTVACARKSLTQSDIVEMILGGKLRHISRSDDTLTLGSLLVDLDELPVSTDGNHGQDDNGNEAVYLNFDEVKTALATTDATVSALVKHRVLPVEVRTNPRTRRAQPFVHRDSIGTFLSNHKSLHKIASGWRRNIAYMRDELERNGMEPIFETSGKIARYYRTEDLARAGLLPPNS